MDKISPHSGCVRLRFLSPPGAKGLSNALLSLELLGARQSAAPRTLIAPPAGGPQQISIKVMRRNSERSWLGRMAKIFLRNCTRGLLARPVPP